MGGLCDFFGCYEPVCEADKELKRPTSLRFCQKHSDEINAYFKSHDIRNIMKFWVRSQGGAKRMARRGI